MFFLLVLWQSLVRRGEGWLAPLRATAPAAIAARPVRGVNRCRLPAARPDRGWMTLLPLLDSVVETACSVRGSPHRHGCLDVGPPGDCARRRGR